VGHTDYEAMVSQLMNSVTFGLFGEFTLGKYLLFLGVGLAAFHFIVGVIALFRTGDPAFAAEVHKTMLRGWLFSLLPFTLPIGFFLVMRAMWMAATGVGGSAKQS